LDRSQTLDRPRYAQTSRLAPAEHLKQFARRLLLKATLLVTSLGMAAGLAELALRVSHFGESNRTPLQKLMEYDSLLGWRHKRNVSSAIVSDEYQINVQYNAEGWRGATRRFSKPPDVFRIMVLGDSFVDGYTLPVQDRFTEVLESSLRPQFDVINLGVAGYSTDQELLLLDQEGWKLEPDLVVLAFYYNDVWGNGSRHFSESSRTQKPVFSLDTAGNLSLSNVPVPYPTPSLQDRFRLYDLVRTTVKRNRFLHAAAVKAGLADNVRPNDSRPAPTGAAGGAEEFAVYHSTETPELAREWSITQALLRKMNQEAVQHGARLMVLYVPTRIELSPAEWSSAHLPSDYDPGVVVRRLTKICQVEGIPYLDPSDRFTAVGTSRMYYPRDPHWNAAGHRLVGETLAEHIRDCSGRSAQIHCDPRNWMLVQHRLDLQ
jgi:SGNH hydrolase-like domain, acetyltransferase AlgX